MPETPQTEKISYAPAEAKIEIAGACASVKISGDWLTSNKRPALASITDGIPQGAKEIKVQAGELGQFDSALISLVLRLHDTAKDRGIKFSAEALPEGAAALVKLATAVPIKKGGQKLNPNKNIFYEVGTHTISKFQAFKEQLAFIGEFAEAFAGVFRLKASFMASDLMKAIQRSGPEALPIVSVINFLVGLIIAFVGAIQLSKFGSAIYIADLVGLAMVREMGAIMVAIVMAGRTGAAFAAELGSMKVNEEIAAYRTFGISPMEFLVLPRMIALVLMFPLLTIFANLMGICGGFVIGWGMFDITYESYISHTLNFLNLTQCMIGLAKSVVFGVIVAMVGCLKGMTCGESSEDVGLATTSSVVTSITLIVVADAVFAVMLDILGI
ncbi:MAG: MlaE family lipid ABC transporter permease subunit [Opitutales bacterium]|nr:MlaE family lipid ABC transporter permease subunit [Opitutales bacterium]